MAKSHSGGLSGTFSVNVSQVKNMSQDDNLNLITNSVDRLFIEAGFLPDKSFKNFILALCQLLDESFESSAKLAVTKSKLVSQIYSLRFPCQSSDSPFLLFSRQRRNRLR